MVKANRPNLFIVGTHKSGTTRLHNLLSLHPMIRSGRVKEPHYYTPLRYGTGLSNFDEYRSLYSADNGAKYFLDSSPSYFYGGDTIIQQIEKNHGSSARYLCIIREPVDRLISYYHQTKIIQPSKYTATLREFFTESVSVKEQLDRDIPVYRGVREGEYVNYMSPWLSLPANKFKLIFFEDLKNNEAHLLESVFDWLGLDNSLSEIKTVSKNAGLSVRSVKLHMWVHKLNAFASKKFSLYQYILPFLKSIYLRINKLGDYPERIDEDMREIIKDYYRSSNQKLCRQLEKSNIGLPKEYLY